MSKDTMTAQEAINALCDHLLGVDWYIPSPVGGEQANKIIVDTIKQAYPKKTKWVLKKVYHDGQEIRK